MKKIVLVLLLLVTYSFSMSKEEAYRHISKCGYGVLSSCVELITDIEYTINNAIQSNLPAYDTFSKDEKDEAWQMVLEALKLNKLYLMAVGNASALYGEVGDYNNGFLMLDKYYKLASFDDKKLPIIKNQLAAYYYYGLGTEVKQDKKLACELYIEAKDGGYSKNIPSECLK